MVNKSDRRPSRRLDLLEAAIQIVAEHGATGLTIDAVAKAAGVTKGGVQYHFASKDILTEELLDWVLTEFNTALDQAVTDDGAPGAWHRAYIGLVLWELSHLDRCIAALLLAAQPGDRLSNQFATMAAHWRQRAIDDGLDPATSMIVRRAADGMWLERTYGGASDTEVAIVRRRLLELIAEAANQTKGSQI